MTINLVAEFAGAITRSASSVRYGDGDLLTLPWSLADGESVSIYVEQVADGLFNLSDRGLAADALALAGVDLGGGAAASSWAAVRDSLDLPAAVMRDLTPFEISGSADKEGLGLALTEVGEAVLRADGLRALGRQRRRLTFKDRVIRHAAERNLTVVPRAKVKTRFGSQREVTCRVQGSDWAYVQALSGGPNFNETYDHARSIFGDTKTSSDHLVSVIADNSKIADWQERSLGELSRVVHESQQDDFWASLAS
ncbi:MAG: hypothetical protein ABIQ59_10355 [Nocardioidaceae bacterium]